MHAGHYAHFCWLGSGIFLSFVSIETLAMRTYFTVVLVLVNSSESERADCNEVVVCMEKRGIVRVVEIRYIFHWRWGLIIHMLSCSWSREET